MSGHESYTPEEVAQILKISKYTVYEMIKRGDLPAYRIGRKIRVEGIDLDKYKQKARGSSAASPPVFSDDGNSGRQSPDTEGLVICGQDMILDVLARHLTKRFPFISFLRQNIGSIDGLMALYRGQANVVTAHLWDSDTDDYNIPYVRRILPGHQVAVINLVFRMEGFYVAKGNPKKIMTWSDLTRSKIRFVNRERGSGARVLLDEKLRVENIDHRYIAGYNDEEMSHLAVASKVARGEADVGLGIEKVALQVNNISFVPLQKERYDLVIRQEDLEKSHFQALTSILKSESFRNEVSGIGNYDVSRMGEIMAIV